MAFERGYVKLKLPYEPNKNHLETMYAGSLYTLGEIPGGAILIGAFDMSKYFPTLASMSTKFIKPATSDITCELTVSEEDLEKMGKEAKETGKSVFELVLHMKDADGVVVAISKGLYHMRTH